MRNLLAATLLIAVFVGACSGGDDSGPSDVASGVVTGASGTALESAPTATPDQVLEWARAYCNTLEVWTVAIDDLRQRSGESAGLLLEERKTRSAVMSAVESEASRTAAEQLNALTPPPDAEEYHRVVTAQFTARIEIVERLEQAMSVATTPAQADAASREYLEAIDGRSRTVAAASQFLTPEIIGALTVTNQCGYLSRPLTT